MAFRGRPALRDLFDDAPTPHIAHPPHTHHRDFYVATDGSFVAGGGGIGAVIEAADGTGVRRLARHDDSPDNNVAEYRALHLGLDVLAAETSDRASVGVLVDHDDLAANVNAVALGMDHPDWPASAVSVPASSEHHWRGIRSRVTRFADVRAASIRSDENPAHMLANAPGEYAHLGGATRSPAADRDPGGIPPPSRADRHAADD